MFKKELVVKDIADGRRLIQALDVAGIQITTAFWWFDREIERWKLVISSPKLAETYSTAAYGLIQRVMMGMRPATDIRLDEIVLEDSQSAIVDSIRHVVKTGPDDLSEIRISSSTIGDLWVEDARVYRAA